MNIPNSAVTPEAGNRALIVRGSLNYRAEQGSDYEPGISSETVGAKALWLGIATIPPEHRTKAHVHAHHETAFYMLSGDELELWTGDQLQYRDVVRPGDYLYIPANLLHVAVNRTNQSAVFVGARNEPTARHRSTKRAQTVRIALPLSLRKSAITLSSGTSLPSNHITSTLRPASRSRRRLDCTRLRYP
jgi:uncharacterized RmlC-like cupin family protein